MDFLVDGKGITAESVQATDPSKIYLCGFAFGGMVGLYAAALDERIKGVASFSGFTPMRTNTLAKDTGGIRKYWEWHAIIPKLGLFHQKESTVPYDYDNVIRMIAPRKCLIYSSIRDRFADIADIKKCIANSETAWTEQGGLEFMSPDDICRFQRDQQDVVIHWLDQLNN